MSDLAIAILSEQRKSWRKDPAFGFVARPIKNLDGTLDLMTWECYIPEKYSTPGEEGFYKLQLSFRFDYPATPPVCKFVPPIFHPNVDDSGCLCSSLLQEEGDWKPSLSVKQILLGIQNLLNEPNINSPVNREAQKLYIENRLEYDKRLKAQAKAMTPKD